MTQKEEIQSRKNKLAERKAALKDQGKSQQLLAKEHAAAEARRKEKEEKAAVKWQLKQERKAEKKAEKEAKKAEKKEAAALKKERKKKEEELAYRQKQADKEAARQHKKDEELTKAITTKSMKDMTNTELQEFIDRYKLEQEYKKIKNENNKSVVKTVTEILYKSGQDAFKDVSKNVLTQLMQEFVTKATDGKYTGKSGKGNK